MGDVGKGKTIFLRACAKCHSTEKTANHKYGPNLHGLFGRKAGRADGYTYSEANTNVGIVWTKDTLFEYLKNPRGYILGTSKNICGMSDEEDRRDVIAYLETVLK